MRSRNKGFTLIELVVVITILGILAAFAVPRFASLSAQARVAAVSAFAGSLSSAASLAHAQYLAMGTSPATVTMEGTAVTLTNGYPDVSSTGITAALQSTTGFTQTGTTTLSWYPTSTAAANVATCTVTYTAAAANASPAIVLTATTC
jgi:MSHA pilin protein MshA